MKNKCTLICIQLVFGGLILLFTATSAHALPSLDSGKFFAPSSLFNASDWSYTGTLPSSISAGFKAKSVDTTCIPLFGCSDTDEQYATGSRSMTTTVGKNPSYKLGLKGEFQEESFENWEDSLLAQSKGNKFDSDINRIDFPAPDQTTNEHPIAENWQSDKGYGIPNGMYAKFDQTYTLSRNFLEPGEYGCQAGGANTGCAYTGAYFKGGVDLSANLHADASIVDNVPFSTQAVNINATANRATTIKVNGDPVFSGTVNGSTTNFHLEEDKVKDVKFSFTANFQEQSISVGTEVTWDGRDETSSIDAPYTQSIQMTDYVNVGLASQYLVEVRDTPQLIAGIDGHDFTSASVSASAELNAIDALLMPVFQPVAASLLDVKYAKIFNIEQDLPIPDGGFKNDINVFLQFLLGNEGSIDLTVDRLDFELVDQDVFFDDLLASLNKNLNYVIHPNSTLALAFNLVVPKSTLNSAVSFLEGNFLEIADTGSFKFHDIYGSREKSFAVRIPEPGTIFLLIAGLVYMITFRAKQFKKNRFITQ